MSEPDNIDNDTDYKPIPVVLVGDTTENVRDVATRFAPHTENIPVGVVICLGQRNVRRKRLCLYTDSGNTSPVLIAASNNGVPNISIAANSGLVEFTHSDAIYASATAAAIVYVFEESYPT